MATPRLPSGPPNGKYDLGEIPKSRRDWAQFLSNLMFGSVAAVARLCGFSERVAEFWIEPQSKARSPYEEVVDLTLALRQVLDDADDAEMPLLLTCALVGGRYLPPQQLGADSGCYVSLETTIADTLSQVHELMDHLLRRCLDDEKPPTPADYVKVESNVNDIQQQLHLLVRRVQARVGRKLQAVADGEKS